jgi:hypothetical protein
MDVSRDRVDIHCLPGNHKPRLPDADEGHVRIDTLTKCPCLL